MDIRSNSVAWIVGLLLSSGALAQAAPDPLPSWNESPAKQKILQFVAAVTKEGGPDYVRPAERIAVFDNDGTLWVEQPFYTQIAFALDRLKEMAPQNPQWKRKKPFSKLLSTPKDQTVPVTQQELLEILMATHSGMTTETFEEIVRGWIATARHPRFNRPYTACVYQPMLELLAYLRAHNFKTYIVSGGGIEFMRSWTEQVYGIPPEQVIGGSIETKFEMQDGQATLIRLPEIHFVGDKEGKPVGIHQKIGRRPIAAFGNSDGDLQMLQWTTAAPGRGRRLGLIVHHDDAKREWAYDRKSVVGRLDQALEKAGKHGWIVVSMKNDWNRLFPFEK